MPWAQVTEQQPLPDGVAGQVAASCTPPTEDVPPVASRLSGRSGCLLLLLLVLAPGRLLERYNPPANT